MICVYTFKIHNVSMTIAIAWMRKLKLKEVPRILYRIEHRAISGKVEGLLDVHLLQSSFHLRKSLYCLYPFMIATGHPHEVHNECNHSSKSSVTESSCKNNTFPIIVIFDDNLVNKNISFKMNVSPVKIYSLSLLKKEQKL